jgi:hypothetical protein
LLTCGLKEGSTLGHKDVRDTMHYLRITDEDVASEILKYVSVNPDNKINIKI